MEKNILSIDLDIIMHPSIDLYNDEVYVNDDPDELWADLEDTYGYERLNILNYDQEVLLNILKLLKKNQNTPLHFIINHEEIVDQLKETTTYNEDKYNIINIDFHHDMWYNPDDLIDLKNDKEYDCANWLGYLYMQKKLSSIIWVKAPTSSKLDVKVYGKNTIPITTWSIKEFFRLDDMEFDEVYFCFSPQWIPPKYRIIYNAIKTLLE